MLYSPSQNAFYAPGIGTPPNDAVQVSDAAYAALFADQEAGKVIRAGVSGPEAVTPSVTAEQRRPSMVLTDIQFAIASVGAGLMTAQEAEEWVAAGTLPSAATAALEAIPEAQRAAARIRFRGARTISRLDPFIALMQSVLSLSDEAVDALFDAGAAL